MRLQWIVPGSPPDSFPAVATALNDPPGLLAAGGDLSAERLIAAYRRGIFPWYEDGQPILWWSPDPRAVLYPDELHVSRSLARTRQRSTFRVTIDSAFNDVVAGCAEPRPGQAGTWITADMAAAYARLHRLGIAHSVESWCGDRLAGGLYGVGIGRVFFGESMFSRESDASKIAMLHLAECLQEWNFSLIDCQIDSPHLRTLGARLVPRPRFLAEVSALVDQPAATHAWHEKTP